MKIINVKNVLKELIAISLIVMNAKLVLNIQIVMRVKIKHMLMLDIGEMLMLKLLKPLNAIILDKIVLVEHLIFVKRVILDHYVAHVLLALIGIDPILETLV